MAAVIRGAKGLSGLREHILGDIDPVDGHVFREAHINKSAGAKSHVQDSGAVRKLRQEFLHNRLLEVPHFLLESLVEVVSRCLAAVVVWRCSLRTGEAEPSQYCQEQSALFGMI